MVSLISLKLKPYFGYETPPNIPISSKKRFLLLIPLLLLVLSTASAMEFPDTLVVGAGTLDSGTVADLGVIDQVYVNISEGIGTPGLTAQVNFTNIGLSTSGDWTFSFTGRYEGTTTHEIYFDLFNFTNTSWTRIMNISDMAADDTITSTFEYSADFVNDSIVRLKMNHPDAGNQNHDFFIDQLSLVDDGICSAVTLSIDTEAGVQFPYSINVPIAFTQVGANECVYSLDDNATNKSFECNEATTAFDVDFDDNYTVSLFVLNTTSGESCSATSDFIIDRSDVGEARGQVTTVLIFGLLTIAALFFFLSGKFDGTFRFLILFVAFGFIFIAFNMITLLVREYLKIPAIINLMTTAYTVLMYSFIFIGFMIALAFSIMMGTESKIGFFIVQIASSRLCLQMRASIGI